MCDLANSGHAIQWISFPPEGGGNSWSIVTDKSFFNRNIPDECHNKMNEFLKAGHKLVCVAFPPAGGNSWSVVTDKSFFNRNIPDECHNKMNEFLKAGHKLRLVAFPRSGGNCWSVIADKTFFNRNVPNECHMILGEMHTGHGPVRSVAFDADGNGWSAVSAAKPAIVYRLPFDDDGGWTLSTGNSDDPGGGHGSSQPFAFDFSHPVGGNVRAARGGKVIFVENNAGNTFVDPTAPGYGTAILIRHSDNTISAYDHLKYQSPKVSLGQIVSRGQVIALSGNTGRSTGPHLHFGAAQFWNSPKDSGPDLKVYFEAKNHIFWLPRVGDAILSNNS
jgi:hypothetical protein